MKNVGFMLVRSLETWGLIYWRGLLYQKSNGINTSSDNYPKKKIKCQKHRFLLGVTLLC